MLKLNVIENIKMNPFIIFASLPDMGRVGGLTSSFLVDHLSAQHIASIYSNEKPWIGVIEGIVENIIEEYKIFASKEHGLIIFNGGSQPEDPSELFGLCNMFIDFCQSIGSIRRLYTSGGSFNDQLTGEPKVFGVATDGALAQILKDSDIPIISNEISSITWFNGLILGISKERSIPGVGLYGEISDKTNPQPLAAKSIIKTFTRLEKLDISTKPFDRQYEQALDNFEKKKESRHYSPGVG